MEREKFFNRKLTLQEKLDIALMLLEAHDDPEFHPVKNNDPEKTEEEREKVPVT